MAVGADATKAGYPLVPDTGTEGLVKWGAREINRTRDFVAQVKALIPSNRPARRVWAGITSGTGNPSGGSDGDIYFKII
ncbi:hypothetical protein PP914_gp043 [Arthrobacter phage Qui]|jgi:hypothetical protein|uniref:Uncharacterized protein n=1 Tax=Arthrobacter phage Qui TaxID=2603260 RepID=A0A5B8WGC3_9CAUD|nr:hypothetical protein PP914_gp043 [Arthrobacter phage Qui]QED11533.1 hypothetical protein SEA_QUI_43 [Arthrobacter phage Qui]QOC56365.1 hypothetical protein SEA_PAELLA_43 [Arthrobacter phage Paella]